MDRRTYRFIQGENLVESALILFLLGILVGSIVLLLSTQVGAVFGAG